MYLSFSSEKWKILTIFFIVLAVINLKVITEIIQFHHSHSHTSLKGYLCELDLPGHLKLCLPSLKAIFSLES